MLNKIGGLARALYVIIAIVAGFVALPMMNVPLVLVVLGLVAGLAMMPDKMVLAAVTVVALPMVGAALANIPAVGAQLMAVCGNLQLGVAGAFATALAIFRRLGATSDVARLEAATGARGVGPLTPREAQVVALVLGGASNRAIAGALFLSEATVRRHLANIFTKVGVSSRTAAAAWARGQGIDPVRVDAPYGPLAR